VLVEYLFSIPIHTDVRRRTRRMRRFNIGGVLLLRDPPATTGMRSALSRPEV